MGIKTTNYNWDIATRGQRPYWNEWSDLWTNVDTELYKRTKDLYMQGKIVYGSDVTGGNLPLKSNPLSNGKIYLGANSVYNELNDRLGIGTVSPESLVDVRNGYIVQAGPGGGIRTYGIGSHALAGAYAGVDFVHTGTYARLMSFAGGGETPKDFQWTCGDGFNCGVILRYLPDSSNTFQIVGGGSDGLRIGNPGSYTTIFYQIGRNQSTGFLNFYGTQVGYNGYLFSGADGGTVKIVGDGSVDISGVLKIDAVQVVGNRVIDARIDDTINSGDATTDGVIDAIRDAMLAHGLIAAA